MNSEKILCALTFDSAKQIIVYATLVECLRKILRYKKTDDLEKTLALHVVAQYDVDGSAAKELINRVTYMLGSKYDAVYVEESQNGWFIHFGNVLEPLFTFERVDVKTIVTSIEFLACVEGFLHYYLTYYKRMGQFRPVFNVNINSVFGEEAPKNFYSCLQFAEISAEITYSNSVKDYSNVIFGETQLKISNKDVCRLEKLADTVATLYGFVHRCVACGVFCKDQYCSKICEKSIPCDSCHKRRLACDYNFEQFTSDSIKCSYCVEGTSVPNFSLSALVELVFENLHAIAAEECGVVYKCDRCETFFMHGLEFEKKKQKTCWQCSDFE